MRMVVIVAMIVLVALDPGLALTAAAYCTHFS
jgi:hypothetical protein